MIGSGLCHYRHNGASMILEIFQGAVVPPTCRNSPPRRGLQHVGPYRVFPAAGIKLFRSRTPPNCRPERVTHTAEPESRGSVSHHQTGRGRSQTGPDLSSQEYRRIQNKLYCSTAASHAIIPCYPLDFVLKPHESGARRLAFRHRRCYLHNILKRMSLRLFRCRIDRRIIVAVRAHGQRDSASSTTRLYAP